MWGGSLWDPRCRELQGFRSEAVVGSRFGIHGILQSAWDQMESSAGCEVGS